MIHASALIRRSQRESKIPWPALIPVVSQADSVCAPDVLALRDGLQKRAFRRGFWLLSMQLRHTHRPAYASTNDSRSVGCQGCPTQPRTEELALTKTVTGIRVSEFAASVNASVRPNCLDIRIATGKLAQYHTRIKCVRGYAGKETSAALYSERAKI